jgi:acetyl esterase/lipase
MLQPMRFAALLATVFLLGNCSHGQQPQASVPQAHSSAATSFSDEASVQENVGYGDVNGHKLLLDIYLPGGSALRPRPAVVLIHGGNWTSFDKSTMRGMGNFLARNGFVAVSIDYRLFDGKENHWPAQLDDAQRSVRWLRANAAKYNIDPDHIGAFGHSAGAQIASLLGMEDTRDNSDALLAKYSSRVEAVVEVSGPTDFTRDHDADGDEFLTKFLNADFAKSPEAWRGASPVFHVAKDNAPFLIVHGMHDENVPIAQAQELNDKLQQAGVVVSFVKVDDVHTFQAPENRRRLAVESAAFFDKYLVASH